MIRYILLFSLLVFAGCNNTQDNICDGREKLGRSKARLEAVDGKFTAYYDEQAATIIANDEILAIYFFEENKLMVFQPVIMRYQFGQWENFGHK